MNNSKNTQFQLRLCFVFCRGGRGESVMSEAMTELRNDPHMETNMESTISQFK